jgi:hypothetical protein
LIESIANSNELSIFETKLITDMIDYKWDNFGQFSHLIGAGIHIIYALGLMRYINNVFLESQPTWDGDIRISPPAHETWLWFLGACLVYPLYYDGT